MFTRKVNQWSWFFKSIIRKNILKQKKKKSTLSLDEKKTEILSLFSSNKTSKEGNFIELVLVQINELSYWYLSYLINWCWDYSNLRVLIGFRSCFGDWEGKTNFCFSIVHWRMGHSSAVWDHRAAIELIKDWNGIDQVVLRNPQGASARVRSHDWSLLIHIFTYRNFLLFPFSWLIVRILPYTVNSYFIEIRVEFKLK